MRSIVLNRSGAPVQRRSFLEYSPAVHRLAASIPIVMVVACVALFSIPAQRSFSLWLVRENGPVELATFLTFVLGGVVGLVAARRAATSNPMAVSAVIAGFALIWIAAGLEEISWGQSLLHFASPQGWARFNTQDEINLHNLEGVQNLHSFLLFAFGVVGLVLPIWFHRRGLTALDCPPSVRVYLGLVAVLGALDWWTDNFPFGDPVDTTIGRLTEVNELILAAAGLWLALVLVRRFGAHRPSVTKHSPLMHDEHLA